jgi:hypothetical protein
MPRISKILAAAFTLAMATAVSTTPPAGAAQGGVKAGYLKCDVAGNMSFIFGSSRDITCTYESGKTHRIDTYTGKIKQFGIDIGYQKKGVIIWAVLAPTNDVEPGALAGDYAGVSTAVAAGYGAGANALVGGYGKSIALQPLSVEGIQGINIAAGIAVLTLQPAK